MGVFFTGWSFANKCIFVLACLMSVTAAYAKIIDLIEDRKIKRYAAERADPAIVEALIQDEAPFGVLALERGHTVEGVWHSTSTTNTPIQGSPASFMSSSIGSYKTNSYLSPLHTARGFELPPPVVEPRPPYARSVSRDRHLVYGKSRSSAEDPVEMKQMQFNSSSQPAVQRFSSPPALLQRDHTKRRTSELLTGSIIENSSLPDSDSALDDSLVYSDLGSEDLAAVDSQTHDLSRRSQSSAATTVLDPRFTEQLHTRRLTHAAEIGQFVPRISRPSTARPSSEVEYLVLPTCSTTPPPPSPPPELSNPFITPRMNSRISLPSSPTMEASSPATPSTFQGLSPTILNSSPLMVKPTIATYPERYYANGSPGNSYVESPTQGGYVVPTERNTRSNSQVLRHVNSGFQVLQPGSLDVNSASSKENVKPHKLRKKRDSIGSSRFSLTR